MEEREKKTTLCGLIYSTVFLRRKFFPQKRGWKSCVYWWHLSLITHKSDSSGVARDSARGIKTNQNSYGPVYNQT